MIEFYDNVSKVLATTGRFRSFEALSRHCFPNNPKALAKGRAQGQEIGLRRAKAIADALGVSLQNLAQPGSALVGERPDPTAFLSIRDHHGVELECFGDLLEFADIYHVPRDEDPVIRPYRSGLYSMATETLQEFGPKAIHQALSSSSNRKLMASLKARYKTAAGGIPMMDTQKLDEKVSVPPYRIKLHYAYLLLGVTHNGGTYVLNYCKPV